MHVLYFCICTCSAQLNMFHMGRHSRNMLIAIIIYYVGQQYVRLNLQTADHKTANTASVSIGMCWLENDCIPVHTISRLDVATLSAPGLKVQLVTGPTWLRSVAMGLTLQPTPCICLFHDKIPHPEDTTHPPPPTQFSAKPFSVHEFFQKTEPLPTYFQWSLMDKFMHSLRPNVDGMTLCSCS